MFTWLAVLNRLHTKEVLISKGVHIYGSVCAFCSEDTETKRSHVLGMFICHIHLEEYQTQPSFIFLWYKQLALVVLSCYFSEDSNMQGGGQAGDVFMQEGGQAEDANLTSTGNEIVVLDSLTYLTSLLFLLKPIILVISLTKTNWWMMQTYMLVYPFRLLFNFSFVQCFYCIFYVL